MYHWSPTYPGSSYLCIGSQRINEYAQSFQLEWFLRALYDRCNYEVLRIHQIVPVHAINHVTYQMEIDCHRCDKMAQHVILEHEE